MHDAHVAALIRSLEQIVAVEPMPKPGSSRLDVPEWADALHAAQTLARDAIDRWKTRVTDTKANLEAAIAEHFVSEGQLGEGELLTEWLVVAAALPAMRTEDENAVYLVVAPDRAMFHSSAGLASWFLFERRDEDRRDAP